MQHDGILLYAAMCLSVDITNGGLDFSKPPFVFIVTLPFYNGFVGVPAQKKEPIIRNYICGLSALRHCVWLFDN